jgi:hypothetical protein
MRFWIDATAPAAGAKTPPAVANHVCPSTTTSAAPSPFRSPGGGPDPRHRGLVHGDERAGVVAVQHALFDDGRRRGGIRGVDLQSVGIAVAVEVRNQQRERRVGDADGDRRRERSGAEVAHVQERRRDSVRQDRRAAAADQQVEVAVAVPIDRNAFDGGFRRRQRDRRSERAAAEVRHEEVVARRAVRRDDAARAVEIVVAVAVRVERDEADGADGVREAGGGEGRRRPRRKAAVAAVQRRTKRGRAGVDQQQVEVAVAVEIPRRAVERFGRDRRIDRVRTRPEAAHGAAQRDEPGRARVHQADRLGAGSHEQVAVAVAVEIRAARGAGETKRAGDEGCRRRHGQ